MYRLLTYMTFIPLISNATGEVFSQNAVARAMQQHMVAIKPLINSVLADISLYYEHTGQWIAESAIDATDTDIGEFPINIEYTIGTPTTVRITFRNSGVGETTIKIPKPLQEGHVELTAVMSDGDTVIERWTCETDIDVGANLWDGYTDPANNSLSPIAHMLGDFYKDCIVNDTL